MTDLCPCCSGKSYAACCQPFHDGAEPETCEQVMRARYCAFVKGEAPFLIRTSHPMERSKLRPGDFKTSFALSWFQLDVLATVEGGSADQQGQVKFRAHFRDASGAEQVHEESSRFSRSAGAWVYRDALGNL